MMEQSKTSKDDAKQKEQDIEEIRKEEIPISMEFTDEWFQNHEITLPYSYDLINIPPDHSTILYSISKEQIFRMR